MNCLNKTRKKISIVIPLYYGRKYVNRLYKMCCASLNKAGVLQESEIIFVNDSPDEQIILPEFKYARLIENKENVGIHKSKCNGLLDATGEFIHFLDQDDKISVDFYKSQLGYLNKWDAVICNAILEHPDYERKLYRSRFAINLVTKPKCYVYVDNRVESLGQCLIRKNSIPPCWIEPKMKVNGADDYYLLLSLFAEKKRIIVNPHTLYRHVYTGKNLSLDSDNMNKSVQSVAELMMAYYPYSPLTKILQNKVSYLEGSRNIRLIGFAIPQFFRKISRKIRG